jgi:hypothetical protein
MLAAYADKNVFSGFACTTSQPSVIAGVGEEKKV